MNRNDWEAQVFASNMNTTARMIAVVVGTFGNWKDDKTVEPGTTKIANMAGVTRDTVDTYLAAMVEQGWIKPVGTGKYNTTIYELCDVVADTTGILARNKRKMNPASLAKMNNLVVDSTGNLDEVDEILVADTSGLSCRTEPGKLPKAEALVADSTGSNLKNHTNNLEEPVTTPAAPVVPIREEPVASPSSPNVEKTDTPSNFKKDAVSSNQGSRHAAWTRHITPGEKQQFDSLARVHGATPEQSAQALEFLRTGSGSRNFSEAITEALEASGVTVGELW